MKIIATQLKIQRSYLKNPMLNWSSSDSQNISSCCKNAVILWYAMTKISICVMPFFKYLCTTLEHTNIYINKEGRPNFKMM